MSTTKSARHASRGRTPRGGRTPPSPVRVIRSAMTAPPSRLAARHESCRTGPRPVVAAATRTASSDAAGSCTRTPHTPPAAASAEIAVVAASRPSGGRGPSASASRAPRNRLRDAPIRTGKPQPGAGQTGHLRQRPEQRPVVLGGLGEAEAGVEHDRRLVDAGRDRGGHPVQQLGAHLGDDVVVAWPARPCRRCARASASGSRAPRRRRRRRPSPGRPARRRRH